MTSLTTHREKIICHNVADFTAIEGSCCCSGPLGITGVARVSLTPSGRMLWGSLGERMTLGDCPRLLPSAHGPHAVPCTATTSSLQDSLCAVVLNI